MIVTILLSILSDKSNNFYTSILHFIISYILKNEINDNNITIFIVNY